MVRSTFRRIFFDLEYEIAEKLEAIRKEKGITQRGILRDLVIEYVGKQERRNAKGKK